MKRISLVSLIVMLSLSAFSQKIYSDKARTSQPDDYMYQDYSYTYNLRTDPDTSLLILMLMDT